MKTIAISLLILAFHFTQPTQNLPQDAYRITEEKFVLINGIEQWVTIKGDSSKPAILFLHGGPGSPISPYADHLYKEWEKDFIIVQWDQRGTGRTYGQQAPEEITPEYLQSNPLTLAQMSADGIALANYLVKRLGKEKIILFGSSWGSVLGVTMATQRPDLFYAYVGHAQIVDPGDDRPMYDRVYQMAKLQNDQLSLGKLDTLGKPPYDRARTVGQLFRIVKKYERQNSIPPPSTWFEAAPAYNNARDEKNREDGDDYSFVHYIGDKKLGVGSMRTAIHFLDDHIQFKIPVYLIQGEEDLMTPSESTRKYYNAIKAPKKEYILLPKTAHGFNEAVLAAQYKIFRSITIPQRHPSLRVQ